MNLDSVDLPSGIGRAYMPKKSQILNEKEVREQAVEPEEVDKTAFVKDWLTTVHVDKDDKESIRSSQSKYSVKTEAMMKNVNVNGNRFIKSNQSSRTTASSKSNKSLDRKTNNSPLSDIQMYPAGFKIERSVKSKSSGSRKSFSNNENALIKLQCQTHKNEFDNTQQAQSETKTHVSIIRNDDNVTKSVDNVTSNSACTNQLHVSSGAITKDWEEIFRKQAHKFNRNGSYSSDGSDMERIRNKMKKDSGLCMCKQCEAELPTDLVIHTERFTEPKRATPKCRPSPLLKTSDELLSSVMTSPSIKPSDTEATFYSQILVHGRTMPHPQTFVNQTNLIKPIQDRLITGKLEKSKPVQSYGWQGIMRGNNVCLINGHKTGKTLTYIPAICSFLIDHEGRYDRIPKGNRGPSVIVLTNTSSVAEEVTQKFLAMLKGNKEITNVWMPILPLNLKKINSRFGAKCGQTDVIITTLDTLIVLLNNKIIDLKRLCHLVVENVDIILDKLQHKFQMILNAIDSMLKNRNCFDGVQFICTGEKWTRSLEKLIIKLDNFPLIIIGNPMQAALYGRADFQLKYLSTKLKPVTLTELLKSSNYNIFKCVIVCKMDEIAEIEDHFANSGINFAITSENKNGEEIMDIHRAWMTTPNGKHLVLISTDKVLRSYLRISNANFLVHYSLPPNWTMFSARFSILLDSYMCPLTSTFNQDKYHPKVVTFVDEKCINRFPKISNFFIQNRMSVPDFLLQYCKDYQIELENEKVESHVKLCKFIKTFGECCIHDCKDRHILSKLLDATTMAPANGQIKGKLVNFKQLNCYYIRILEYKDFEGKTHKLEDHARQVEEYLENCTGFEIATKIEKGQCYLYCCNRDIYRCIVERIVEYVPIGNITTDQPRSVEIFGLDNAIKMVTFIDKLFTLPDQLKTIPQSVTEVVVANIVPPFKESMWTDNACKNLMQEFRNFNRDVAVCVANILLRLDGTIWVDDLRLKEMKGPFCKSFSLCVFLKERNLYEQSDDSLNKLYKLCEDAGIDLPEYKILQNEVVKLPPKLQQSTPQWAHLTKDELNSVHFSSAASADSIFVKHSKFDYLLKQLEESIKKSANLLHRKLLREEVIEGYFYANIDEVSDNFCRVLLTEIVDDMAKCFYVDYGDSVTVPITNLKYLSNDHLIRLPFQAIECSLYGVEETNPSEKLLDAIYECGFVENTDFFKTLYAMHMAEETVQHKHVATTKYRIILMDYSNGHSTSINKYIIDKGLVQNHPEESLDIDLPKLQEIPDETIANEGNYDCAITEQIENINGTESNDVMDNKQQEFNDADFDLIWGHDAKPNCESLNHFERMIDYFKETSKESETPSKATTSKPAMKKPEFIPIKAANVLSDKVLPRINWYQNNTEIFLEFIFIENNDYKVQIIRNRFLNFSSLYKGKHYALNVNLFNTVRKHLEHHSKTHCIRVTLTKEKDEDWPRLIKSEEPMLNIKYKIEEIEISDSEDEEAIERLGIDEIDPKVFDHVEVSPEGNVYEFYSDYDDSESDYDDAENNYDGF